MKTTFKEDFENELLRLDITISELASMTGINDQTIRNWKHGWLPQKDKFEKIKSVMTNLEPYHEYEKMRDEFDGLKLNRMMKKKGISASFLASKIGVTEQSIDNYLKGRKPKGAVLRKICDEFNVQPNFWLKDDEVTEPFEPKVRCDSKVIERQQSMKSMSDRIKDYDDLKSVSSLEKRIKMLEEKVEKLEQRKGFLGKIFG